MFLKNSFPVLFSSLFNAIYESFANCMLFNKDKLVVSNWLRVGGAIMAFYRMKLALWVICPQVFALLLKGIDGLGVSLQRSLKFSLNVCSHDLYAW